MIETRPETTLPQGWEYYKSIPKNDNTFFLYANGEECQITHAGNGEFITANHCIDDIENIQIATSNEVGENIWIPLKGQYDTGEDFNKILDIERYEERDLIKIYVDNDYIKDKFDNHQINSTGVVFADFEELMKTDDVTFVIYSYGIPFEPLHIENLPDSPFSQDAYLSNQSVRHLNNDGTFHSTDGNILLVSPENLPNFEDLTNTHQNQIETIISMYPNMENLHGDTNVYEYIKEYFVDHGLTPFFPGDSGAGIFALFQKDGQIEHRFVGTFLGVEGNELRISPVDFDDPISLQAFEQQFSDIH